MLIDEIRGNVFPKYPLLNKSIDDAFVVHSQNLYDYLMEAKKGSNLVTDFPFSAPSFDRMWFE